MISFFNQRANNYKINKKIIKRKLKKCLKKRKKFKNLLDHKYKIFRPQNPQINVLTLTSKIYKELKLALSDNLKPLLWVFLEATVRVKNSLSISCSRKYKSKHKMKLIGLGKCLRLENLLPFFIKITLLKILVKNTLLKEQTGKHSKEKPSVFL